MHLLISMAVLIPILHALPAPSFTISPNFSFGSGQVTVLAPPTAPLPKARPNPKRRK